MNRELSANSYVNLSQEANSGVFQHWASLQKTAETQLNNGETTVAVIVAQTACEVVVARAICNAGGDVNEVSSCSLCRCEDRQKYDHFTNDSIGQERFWSGYREMVRRRNQAIHSGKRITEQVAKECLDTARQFIAHVQNHNGLGPAPE